ncbi:MAG: putative quinol monooxygenase [Prochloraceae cyanobacterium]|nr:putative quinol monooxygenase [Prochloraceae cyanobacterium]
MANERVTVIAKIKVKPGMEEKFKAEYLPVVELTRKEVGCINYDLHQSAEDKNTFLLYENWVSKENLDKHLQMPYIKALGEKAPEFLAESPKIEFWQKIS